MTMLPRSLPSRTCVDFDTQASYADFQEVCAVWDGFAPVSGLIDEAFVTSRRMFVRWLSKSLVRHNVIDAQLPSVITWPK